MKYSFSSKGILLIFLSLPVLLFIESCSDKSKKSLKGTESHLIESDSIDVDLDQMVDFNFDQIKKRGTIRIAIENNSTGYFLYKGRPMGFQYELINNFCDDNNLQMEIILENDFYKSFQMLVKGEVDVITHPLTITRNRKKIISFIDPLYEVRQMLVQHKPEGWEKMKKHQIENKLIKSPSELVGKEIHVRKGSSYLNRLHYLFRGFFKISFNNFPGLKCVFRRAGT